MGGNHGGTHTWWGAHIHGVEPTNMVAWPAGKASARSGLPSMYGFLSELEPESEPDLELELI